MQRDEAEALPHRVVERLGRLDVLVNNAGIILVAPFEDHTVEDFERSLAVHFWAPLHLSRAALPYLRQAGEGRIVTISSIGGRVAVPHLAAYCAGKFAGVALSECLQAELRPHGIRVTTVMPALMRTGSFVRAELRGRHEAEAAWFGVASSAPLVTIDAGVAARRIVAACRRGDPVLTLNWSAKVGVRVEGAAPGLVSWLRTGAAALLPEPGGDTPREAVYEHPGEWVPSAATQLGDQAAVENLELVGEAARYPAPRA
jgi:short-subunit dehydrogenase